MRRLTLQKTAAVSACAMLLLMCSCSGKAEETAQSASMAQSKVEHEEGEMNRVSVAPDRTPTADEVHFTQAFHTDADELFTVLTVTGTAMPQQQLYSVSDLESLCRLSFQYETLNSRGLPVILSDGAHTFCGVNLMHFLALCGADLGGDAYLSFYGGGDTVTVKASDIDAGASLIAFSEDFTPLNAASTTQGPLYLKLSAGGRDYQLGALTKLIIGENPPADPDYLYHNRSPYDQSLDKTFTVNVYKKGSEYLGALQTKTFTTAALEQLAQAHPDAVVSGYYGTIGDAKVFPSMGVGGWQDYFTGISLAWLMTNQLEITDFSGSAAFFGRDGLQYTQVDDLRYFTGDKADYNIVNRDGLVIHGSVPMIAFAKNGYPLLPEHDHECVGYVAYNELNNALADLGIYTEIGVIKNHSGPFCACLGNRDGLYGGYRIETGGDCVRMDIYLD
ncbi:MAG: hypothetical protein QM689_11505 [Oscillospiraceae bacterium]